MSSSDSSVTLGRLSWDSAVARLPLDGGRLCGEATAVASASACMSVPGLLSSATVPKDSMSSASQGSWKFQSVACHHCGGQGASLVQAIKRLALHQGPCWTA